MPRSKVKQTSGIIYDLLNGSFGLALHNEQHDDCVRYNKAKVHIFTDALCTIPKTDPGGRKLIGLKDKSKIKAIGFSD